MSGPFKLKYKNSAFPFKEQEGNTIIDAAGSAYAIPESTSVAAEFMKGVAENLSTSTKKTKDKDKDKEKDKDKDEKNSPLDHTFGKHPGKDGHVRADHRKRRLTKRHDKLTSKISNLEEQVIKPPSFGAPYSSGFFRDPNINYREQGNIKSKLGRLKNIKTKVEKKLNK